MNFSNVNIGGLSPTTLMQNFNAFAKSLQGQNAQQIVQNLLNSGKMTQSQYNQYRAMANQILGGGR